MTSIKRTILRDNVALFCRLEPGPRVDFLRADKSSVEKLLENSVTTTVEDPVLRMPAWKDLLDL